LKIVKVEKSCLGSNITVDCREVKRFHPIEKLNESEKEHVFALLDAFLAKSMIHFSTAFKTVIRCTTDSGLRLKTSLGD